MDLKGSAEGEDAEDCEPQFLAVSADTKYLVIGTKNKVMKQWISSNETEIIFEAKDTKKERVIQDGKNVPKNGIRAMAFFSMSLEDDITKMERKDDKKRQKNLDDNFDHMIALVFDDKLEIHTFQKGDKKPNIDELAFNYDWLRPGIAEEDHGGEDFPKYTSAKFSCRDEHGDIYLALGGKHGDREEHGGRAELFSVKKLKDKVQKRATSLRQLSRLRGSQHEFEVDDNNVKTLEQFFVKRLKGVTTCIDLSPNADRMIVGGTDRIAAVYVLPRLSDSDHWKSKWASKKRGKAYYEVKADWKIDDVAFSGDGCRFAVAHSKRVDVHDSSRGSFIFSVEVDRVIKHIECSRDGRQLAIASRFSRKALQIWDMHTGTHKLFEHEVKKGCKYVAFSPCGTFVAVASKTNVERVRPQTGAVKLQKSVDDEKGVTAVAASPCGNYFAFGTTMKVNVFTTKLGERVDREIPIDYLPRSLIFHEHTYATGGKKGQTWLYLCVADYSEGKKRSSVRIFEVCRTKRRQASEDDEEAESTIKELDSSKILVTHETQVCLATTNGRGETAENFLVVGSSNISTDKGNAVVYNWAELLNGVVKGLFLDALHHMCLCCDITLGAKDYDEPDQATTPKQISKYDTEDGESIDEENSSDNWNPGIMVVYGGLEPSTRRKGHIQHTCLLRVIEVAENKIEAFPANNKKLPVSESVRACKFAPGGRSVVIAGDSRRLMIFSTQWGELQYTINLSDSPRCLEFSLGGNFLAVGGNNKSVTIIDTEEDASVEDKIPRELFRLTRGGIVFGVAFSCPPSIDDRESALVVGSADKTCTVFEKVLRSGPPIGVLHEEAQSVERALVYNPLLPVITRYEFSMLDRCLRVS